MFCSHYRQQISICSIVLIVQQLCRAVSAFACMPLKNIKLEKGTNPRNSLDQTMQLNSFRKMSIAIKKRNQVSSVPPSLTAWLQKKTACSFDSIKEQVLENMDETENSFQVYDVDTGSNSHGQLFLDMLLEELFRYLYLLAKYPAGEPIQVSPSELVDKALHILILDPELYFHVCDALLTLQGQSAVDRPMRVLPHNLKGGKDRAAQLLRLKQTIHDYEAAFSEIPSDIIWSVRPANCSNNVTSSESGDQYKAVTSNTVPKKTKGDSMMQIFVRVPGGKSLTLYVDERGAIVDLNQKILEKLDIQPCDQYMVFASKVLKEGETLEYYNIQKESTIHLHLKVRGC